MNIRIENADVDLDTAGWCRLCAARVARLRAHLHRIHGRLLRAWLDDTRVKEEQLRRNERER